VGAFAEEQEVGQGISPINDRLPVNWIASSLWLPQEQLATRDEGRVRRRLGSAFVGLSKFSKSHRIGMAIRKIETQTGRWEFMLLPDTLQNSYRSTCIY
jgi:hypothetical protein